MEGSLPTSSPRAVARALAVLASAVLAAPLAAPLAAQSGTYVDNHVRVGYQVSSEPVTAIRVDHFACAPTPASVLGSCSIPGLMVALDASTSPGGVMRARTAMSASGAVVVLQTVPPPDIRNAFFSASSGTGFWDRVTFGAFTPAALRLSYLLDGTVSTTLPAGGPTYASAYGTIGFSASQTGAPGAWTPLVTDGIIGEFSQSRAISQTGFVDIPLGPGGFLDFTVGMNTWVDIGGGLPGTVLTGAGLADFSHTARIGIQALDAAGRDVTAAAGLVFASGARYPTSPTAVVPEPATVALLGTGLLALAGLATRRRRREG